MGNQNNHNQNNPNQHNQNQANQKQGSQQSAQQNNASQPGREVNPTRPSGERGQLPQNAGSALNQNNANTATQQGQQSKSQSAQGTTPKHEQQTDPRNKPDSKGTSRNTQDEDKPTGISEAVNKGVSKSQNIDSADEIGDDEDSAGGKFPGREKGAM